VGVSLIRIAYGLNIGDGIAKAVLVAMADAGCDQCGMAWPGVSYLERKVEFGATTIRNALAALTNQGLIEIRAYAKGGRGMATEYVVLRQFIELSTAPCGKCSANLTKPSRRGGYDNAGTNKPTVARGVSAKPTAKGVQNPPRGGDQPSVEPEPSHAETSAAPQHGPSEPPPPRNAQEALARVTAMTRGIGVIPSPKVTPRPKGDHPSAETDG